MIHSCEYTIKTRGYKNRSVELMSSKLLLVPPQEEQRVPRLGSPRLGTQLVLQRPRHVPLLLHARHSLNKQTTLLVNSTGNVRNQMQLNQEDKKTRQ